MFKKIIIITGIILFVLVIGFIFMAAAGIFQRPAQPFPGDVCYGTEFDVLGCSYSSSSKMAQVTLKLKSGRFESVQGILSGEIAGSKAGSVDVVELGWDAPYQKIVEFNFDKTVDGLSLDNFEGPFKFQVRPILDGKQCPQFNSISCKSN